MNIAAKNCSGVTRPFGSDYLKCPVCSIPQVQYVIVASFPIRFTRMQICNTCFCVLVLLTMWHLKRQVWIRICSAHVNKTEACGTSRRADDHAGRDGLRAQSSPREVSHL